MEYRLNPSRLILGKEEALKLADVTRTVTQE